jgi:Cu+-exporting ATPase
MRADRRPFAHEHARVDTPGIYRLWGQFRLGDGTLITVPFTVEAA